MTRTALRGALVAAATASVLAVGSGTAYAGPDEYVTCTTVFTQDIATAHSQLVNGDTLGAVDTLDTMHSDYESCANII